MLKLITKIWTAENIKAESRRDQKVIVALNKVLLILIVCQAASLISHMVNGRILPATMTADFIVGLLAVIGVLRLGLLNQAKLTIIIILVIYVLAMAFLWGPETHVIEFLVLTALMPLFFFELENTKRIFWSTMISIAPLALYHYVVPFFHQYTMSYSEQVALYRTVIPMKLFCLCIILYLIYYKNNEHEEDKEEKQQQLLRQKNLYESILDQMPIGIVTFDKDMNYTYINSMAIDDAALRASLIGRSNTDYYKEKKLSSELAGKRNNILRTSLEKGTAVKVEETFVNAGGEVKYSIKGATPLYDADGDGLSCVLGYSMDITDIKEAENKVREYSKQLRRKNADLERFVDITSHELKTPLRNTASFLQLIKRKLKDQMDGDTAALMDHAVQSVKHLDKLISDIYLYTSTNIDRSHSEETTDITRVMADVVLQLKDVIGDRNARVRYEDLPAVKASAQHMSAVLYHLIANALEYNKSEVPAISVAHEETPDYHIFNISDNGIGIADEHHAQIFEVFRRLHGPDQYSGTGIGLAICKKIVEGYGGKIWASPNAGGGTTFTFTLVRDRQHYPHLTTHELLSFKELAISRQESGMQLTF